MEHLGRGVCSGLYYVIGDIDGGRRGYIKTPVTYLLPSSFFSSSQSKDLPSFGRGGIVLVFNSSLLS